jgi:hypothetical protein
LPANPEGGGLGGAVLAQSGCDYGDCAIQPQSPNYSPGGLLGLIINFFEDLFGGGGQPTFIPPGDYRHTHYPAMSFITDSQADIQQFTPHQQQKSHAIEILEAIGVGVAVVGIAAAVIFAPEALPALVEAGEALVPMADAAYAGTIRTIAGYEVAGNAGVVGSTYNLNIWGLYAT